MLTDLKEEFKNLNEDELKIVEARQVGFSLNDLNNDEFDAALTGIIFNISVICGCQLPTHEVHVNALEKEFMIFLRNYGYIGLTPEEVLTAFRMNANYELEKKIETYQAVFNIDFAGKVLVQYVNKRWSLDYKLFKCHEKKEVERVFEDESNSRRKKIKLQFEKYLSDDKSELDLENCYMQLIEDRAFSDPESYKTFYAATRITDALQKTDVSIGDILKGYNVNLDEMFAAQRRATLFLFEQMKKTNRLDIYDSELKLLHPGFTAEDQEKAKL